ncbi:MAG: competence/damage-inducible protein A [Crocinitomicaceae bacterium]|nr:competence/damage-inducible protein A [Crocinitomicaceae bacterium]
MQAEIISIGDELLLGQTINTNASWIGRELALVGIPVQWGITIADEREAIIHAFDQAMKRSQLVIVTGGLGPTKDDITKQVLCEYFDTELEINPAVLERVESFFKNRNREMLDVNIQQAALPKSCRVINNYTGTASGMWFEKNGSILVSLPGVPFEMKGMMTDILIPEFKKQFQVPSIYHKTILTTGIGESYLADRIQDWENRVRANGLGLAYLPSPVLLKLRLTSSKGQEDSDLIQAYFDEIAAELPEFVFGYEEEELNEVVGNLLMQNGKTVGTVESCTAGGIAHFLTATPGSSAYFQGGLVTYSNELKEKLAHVKSQTLAEFGAVSEEVVREMAMGGLKQLGVDYCISVSGIAGPDGGTEEKPVGTVWISVASNESVVSKKYNFGNNRERNVQMSIFASVNLLRNVILRNKI